MLALISSVGYADHDGPIRFVDIKNIVADDNDCDFHYRSLAKALENTDECPLEEFSIVLVDPGTYAEGILNVTVKGVIIQSNDGAPRTKINGCFNITEQKVELRGFDINADIDNSASVSCLHAVTVGEREVQLHNNIIHDAEQNGIEVLDFSDLLILNDNHVFNNKAIGIHILDDSDGIQITKNRIQSNGASGVVLEGSSDRFSILDNEITLNLGTGVLVLGADGGQLSNNILEANTLEGIKLDKSHDNVIVENTVSANGLFGISLVGSDNNEVKNNTLTRNRAGGVALRGDGVSSQRNAVEDNTIVGNSQSGASGVLLEGSVTGSIVRQNTIHQNSTGIRLTESQVLAGEPSNNTLDTNDIQNSDEDGIRVESSSGLNTFLSNDIMNNNLAGILVTGGSGNDEFSNNTVSGNGGDGVRIENSDRNTIRENTITANGGSDGSGTINDGAAIVLLETNSTSLRSNILQDGEANGILMSNTSSTKLFDNTIERFRQDGVRGMSVDNVLMEDNIIQTNRERGVSFSTCTGGVDLQRNEITGNTLGGVYVNTCPDTHLQMNEITSNLRYGLWAEESGIVEARRNWWGDSKGPAGVFEGSGNAVIMLGVNGGNSTLLEEDEILESVMPWLTDRMSEQVESSVSGFLLRDFGPGKVELDATDHADVRLSLFSVEQEERGIAIIAKYASPLPGETSIHAPADLPNAVKSVSFLTNGFGSGNAVIDIEYDDSELTEALDKSTLRLHVWDGASWQVLPGKSLQEINLVEGEIDVAALRNVVVIALAPQQ
jgi:parallel beta-helix repeat protein